MKRYAPYFPSLAGVPIYTTTALHVTISSYPRKHSVLVTSKRIEIECKTIRLKGKEGKGDLKNQSNRRKQRD